MPRLTPPMSGVVIRMYRRLLGDCFLLAFASDQPDHPYYMLIDCGVMMGTPDSKEKITRVVEDIKEATGGQIHLLALSHEHWDHIGGFLEAKEAFQGLKIHNVWLPWTESPDDDQAKDLRRRFEKQIHQLRLALGRTRNDASLTPVVNLLGFYGESLETLRDSAAAVRVTRTRAAFDAANELADRAPREYLSPGSSSLPLPIGPGLTVPGVRVYALGPPRDEKALRRLLPTKTGQETYEESLRLSALTAFSMALYPADTSMTEEERELYNLCFPFEESVRLDPAHANTFEFFREHYGTDDHEAAWRRVDDDWLGVAGELALAMDNYTNNTSLVLAIELTASRKVLLFTGDAQVGSWLSWDTLAWSKDDGTDTQTETVKDLLERTVFYKVGHHGSHNATVRGLGEEKKGLELMTNRDLVAMISVDHGTALTKGWTKMPFVPLLKELEVKTRGRTIRGDQDLPDARPDKLTEEEWQAFKNNFRQEELYVEYTIN